MALLGEAPAATAASRSSVVLQCVQVYVGRKSQTVQLAHHWHQDNYSAHEVVHALYFVLCLTC